MDSAEKRIQYKMEIDDYAMKRLKKTRISECELAYTTGKIVNDWKKNDMRFVELFICHPVYPVELLYDLDLSKINKNAIAHTLYFRKKEYKIEAVVEESGSFLNTVMNFFKK